MKRVLMILVAAVAALLLGAAPATAAPYPPLTPTVTTNAGSYVTGSPVIITANGFGKCVGVVTFTITPPGGGTPIVVTAPANGSGVATVTITAPMTVGTYRVVATCGSLTATTSFAVRLLPATGSNVELPLQAGAVLVLAGSGLVVVAMRRRRRTTTAIA